MEKRVQEQQGKIEGKNKENNCDPRDRDYPYRATKRGITSLLRKLGSATTMFLFGLIHFHKIVRFR